MLLALSLLAAVAALTYAFQRHLLFPSPKRNSVLESPHHRIEPVTIAVNGKVLRGYRALPTVAPQEAPGLLFFNGRREHPTSIFRALPALPDHEVLCFFYDGLGWSWSKPGERGLIADGLAVLDWWVSQRAMPADRVSVAGRSLGSGIAVQVAAARSIRRLVLISPHDRLISVINARWPWIPPWWLKDRFDSQTHMERVRCPCLLVVGDRDTTIPAETSRALFSGWDGALSEFVAQGSGHRGLLKRSDVHRALAEFL